MAFVADRIPSCTAPLAGHIVSPPSGPQRYWTPKGGKPDVDLQSGKSDRHHTCNLRALWQPGILSGQQMSIEASSDRAPMRRSPSIVSVPLADMVAAIAPPPVPLHCSTRSPEWVTKSFMRASRRSLRKDAGFGDSSVSSTDSVSQLNRETARSVTVPSTI